MHETVPSVIEILAAMALGPMLAVPASEQPGAMTPSEMHTLKELSDLALAEINARTVDLMHAHSLDIIEEECSPSEPSDTALKAQLDILEPPPLTETTTPPQVPSQAEECVITMDIPPPVLDLPPMEVLQETVDLPSSAEVVHIIDNTATTEVILESEFAEPLVDSFGNPPETFLETEPVSVESVTEPQSDLEYKEVVSEIKPADVEAISPIEMVPEAQSTAVDSPQPPSEVVHAPESINVVSVDTQSKSVGEEQNPVNQIIDEETPENLAENVPQVEPATVTAQPPKPNEFVLETQPFVMDIPAPVETVPETQLSVVDIPPPLETDIEMEVTGTIEDEPQMASDLAESVPEPVEMEPKSPEVEQLTEAVASQPLENISQVQTIPAPMVTDIEPPAQLVDVEPSVPIIRDVVPAPIEVVELAAKEEVTLESQSGILDPTVIVEDVTQMLGSDPPVLEPPAEVVTLPVSAPIEPLALVETQSAVSESSKEILPAITAPVGIISADEPIIVQQPSLMELNGCDETISESPAPDPVTVSAPEPGEIVSEMQAKTVVNEVVTQIEPVEESIEPAEIPIPDEPTEINSAAIDPSALLDILPQTQIVTEPIPQADIVNLPAPMEVISETSLAESDPPKSIEVVAEDESPQLVPEPIDVVPQADAAEEIVPESQPTTASKEIVPENVATEPQEQIPESQSIDLAIPVPRDVVSASESVPTDQAEITEHVSQVEPLLEENPAEQQETSPVVDQSESVLIEALDPVEIVPEISAITLNLTPSVEDVNSAAAEVPPLAQSIGEESSSSGENLPVAESIALEPIIPETELLSGDSSLPEKVASHIGLVDVETSVHLKIPTETKSVVVFPPTSSIEAAKGAPAVVPPRDQSGMESPTPRENLPVTESVASEPLTEDSLLPLEMAPQVDLVNLDTPVAVEEPIQTETVAVVPPTQLMAVETPDPADIVPGTQTAIEELPICDTVESLPAQSEPSSAEGFTQPELPQDESVTSVPAPDEVEPESQPELVNPPKVDSEPAIEAPLTTDLVEDVVEEITASVQVVEVIPQAISASDSQPEENITLVNTSDSLLEEPPATANSASETKSPPVARIETVEAASETQSAAVDSEISLSSPATTEVITQVESVQVEVPENVESVHPENQLVTEDPREVPPMNSETVPITLETNSNEMNPSEPEETLSNETIVLEKRISSVGPQESSIVEPKPPEDIVTQATQVESPTKIDPVEVVSEVVPVAVDQSTATEETNVNPEKQTVAETENIAPLESELIIKPAALNPSRTTDVGDEKSLEPMEINTEPQSVAIDTTESPKVILESELVDVDPIEVLSDPESVAHEPVAAVELAPSPEASGGDPQEVNEPTPPEEIISHTEDSVAPVEPVGVEPLESGICNQLESVSDDPPCPVIADPETKLDNPAVAAIAPDAEPPKPVVNDIPNSAELVPEKESEVETNPETQSAVDNCPESQSVIIEAESVEVIPLKSVEAVPKNDTDVDSIHPVEIVPKEEAVGTEVESEIITSATAEVDDMKSPESLKTDEAEAQKSHVPVEGVPEEEELLAAVEVTPQAEPLEPIMSKEPISQTKSIIVDPPHEVSVPTMPSEPASTETQSVDLKPQDSMKLVPDAESVPVDPPETAQVILSDEKIVVESQLIDSEPPADEVSAEAESLLTEPPVSQSVETDPTVLPAPVEIVPEIIPATKEEETPMDSIVSVEVLTKEEAPLPSEDITPLAMDCTTGSETLTSEEPKSISTSDVQPESADAVSEVKTIGAPLDPEIQSGAEEAIVPVETDTSVDPIDAVKDITDTKQVPVLPPVDVEETEGVVQEAPPSAEDISDSAVLEPQALKSDCTTESATLTSEEPKSIASNEIQPEGSIAEREVKKWYNAVEMPNNPYAPEALKQRISGTQERYMDVPNISPSAEHKALASALTENPDPPSPKTDYKRYSRDYYINNAPTPADSTASGKAAASVAAEDVQDIVINEAQKEGQQPQELVYKALPVQVLDESLDSQSNPSLQSLQTTATTTSDESDTVRIYDFNKQETTVIRAAPAEQQPSTSTTSSMESAQSAPPSVSSIDSSVPKKRERPVVLQFGPGDSAPTIGSPASTPTRGSTPPAFRFLQPKRRLIDPSQVLSVDEDDVPEPTTPAAEKPVIEDEVVHAMPSVKALAQAFLLTSKHTQPQRRWRAKVRIAAPPATPDKPDTSLTKRHKLEHGVSMAEVADESTIASDLSSLETDPSIHSEGNPPIASPASPVPVRHGFLRSNIAFFENLKFK
ncbi:titin homolog isoform X1 [Drosophila biarmipes]|uniref:titin homolog isoform X1 n=1 Tax=Drosophila biarmipes TaxID=125945 RepID=UPI0021CC9896|nr:titin homolog isoform X1 [Drosophila biarmipes]